jgi:RND family efflux transporter MFP subunit
MRKIIFGLAILALSLNAKNIYATFNIEAVKNANLAFSSSGIVKDVLVDITSVVKKDAIIAKLKNDDLKSILNIAKVELKSAEVNLKFAKKEYNRQLKVKKIIDASKFDKYALNYENAKIKVELMKSKIANSLSMLDKTILKAPFDGIIYEKIVEVGDVVSGQGIRTILKIQSKNARKLILEFDQKYHNSVNIGDIFKYKIDGDKKEYQGFISKIYPYANKNTRKIKAEVKTTNVIVGLFGDGYITTSK